jgi:hypothetical protein
MGAYERSVVDAVVEVDEGERYTLTSRRATRPTNLI